jgi:hypothetical protein
MNSSNSNIEEEFEQIKFQLMALSNNLNQNLDGGLRMGQNNQDEQEENSDERSVSLS